MNALLIRVTATCTASNNLTSGDTGKLGKTRNGKVSQMLRNLRSKSRKCSKIAHVGENCVVHLSFTYDKKSRLQKNRDMPKQWNEPEQNKHVKSP